MRRERETGAGLHVVRRLQMSLLNHSYLISYLFNASCRCFGLLALLHVTLDAYKQQHD
jgi:hypothetical protein